MSVTEDGLFEAKVMFSGEKGEVISFENLDFTKINFKLIERNVLGASIESIYIGEQTFIYTDRRSNTRKELVLNVICHKVEDKFTHEESDRSYSFEITDDEHIILKMAFSINARKECLATITKMAKTLDLAGFGGACYKKMIYFMEYVSEKDDLEFVHNAFMASKLPVEKWNKVFETILKERGYEPMAFEKDKNQEMLPIEWQKHYKGRSKN